MTTTESQLTGTSLETSRWPISRVLVGFIVGVLLVAIVAVGSVLAYEQNYAGKIASGVPVGGVDVTGLTCEQAADKLGRHSPRSAPARSPSIRRPARPR
jgi:hypothetical protein